MVFMGRLEGHYDRFGLYLANLDFEPRVGNGIMKGLHNEMATLSTMAWCSGTRQPKGSAAGGRGRAPAPSTFTWAGAPCCWKTGSIGSTSSSQALTGFAIDGKITMELGPSRFATADGNVGGFGTDNVAVVGSVIL